MKTATNAINLAKRFLLSSGKIKEKDNQKITLQNIDIYYKQSKRERIAYIKRSLFDF